MTITVQAPDAAVSALQAAFAAVEEADIPPEYKQLGFVPVLTNLMMSAGSDGQQTQARRNQTTSPNGHLETLAEKTGASMDAVQQIFYVDEASGQLKIGLAASKFGSKTADAARRISLLTTVARQLTTDEQWTEVGVLREACHEYNAVDSGNFAKHVLSLKNVLQFQGGGPQRKVRITRPALEAAGRLIEELAG